MHCIFNEQPKNSLEGRPAIEFKGGDSSSCRFLKQLLWQDRCVPAFWTIVSLLSISIYIVLVVTLIIVGQQLFAMKSPLTEQLIAGLYENLILMDHGRVKTSLLAVDTFPIQFDLPVETATIVKLTENTRIRGATVNLSIGSLVINHAPINIVLPAGTELPIKLNITVPVDARVPVELTVPFDIAMEDTELQRAFVVLREILAPYINLLSILPNTWQDTALCSRYTVMFCQLLLGQRT